MLIEIEDIEEEDVSEYFSKSDFMDILEEEVKSNAESLRMRMPHIELKNAKAQEILDNALIQYVPTKEVGGSVSRLGTHKILVRINPIGISIIEEDFNGIYNNFKHALHGVISHELIHAIQYAYAHASIPDLDEDNDYGDLSDDAIADIEIAKYENRRYKNKMLPWHSRSKLDRDIDKYRDIDYDAAYYNRRLEIEAYSTNLALFVFESLEEEGYNSKQLFAMELEDITDEELGSRLQWVFKHIPITGNTPYAVHIRDKDKKREFLTHAFKRLKYIIKEYIRDNS